MNYFQGQRIRCRGEEWQINKAQSFEIVNGESVWEVQAKGLTGIVKGMDFSFMSNIDSIEVIDPKEIEPEIDTSPKARKAKLYWEAHLRRLLPRNGAIYLGQHGACSPYEYQLEPAAQALNLMRPRMLIGDSVGLGKTIECGVLLSELMRRGKANRVLCAVPKAILEQFQNEMWGRFSIPFHRLDSKGLERLKQDLPSTMNPFYHFEKVIISVDTLKLKKYQKLLQECEWDVFIVDECHNVADRTDGGGGSARHRVAKRIAETANSVILMSATPHDGTRPGFASLIKLLDRTRIKDDTEYTRADFDQHFIRRTRTDVATQIKQRGRRKQEVVEVPLSPDEQDLLQSIHDGEKLSSYVTKTSKRGSKELFKTTLIKSFLSSPQALAQTVKNKLKTMEKSSKAPNQDTENFMQYLRDLEHGVQELDSFSRFDRLVEYIKDHPVTNKSRLVIFTERIATMKALADHLIQEGIADGEFDPDSDKQAKGILLAKASGGSTDVTLQKIVKGFQASTNGFQILVTTNVASEGLNLHQNCHRLIHFDLPWSLITLEQRNGRIDRLGQTETPQVFYFASRATQDTKETKAADLKDDFWIVSKIERRIETASLDMDEQALSRFASRDMEEEQNTEDYENNKITDDDSDDFESMFVGLSEQEEDFDSDQIEIKRKPLATLYEKTPSDFVKGVCEESSDLEVDTDTNHAAKLKLKGSLRHEVDQWPQEFRPESEKLHLEGQADKMEKYYLKCLANNTYIERSFMNEIHPFMSLLENTAIGFFKGASVPTVTLKGDKEGVIHFLVQSTLFNQCNDIVMQYWQVLSCKKRSKNLNPLVDITSNDHAIEVAEWLKGNLSKIKQKKDLDDLEKRRIRNLADSVIEEMASITKEARASRGRRLAPILKEEVARIRSWEKQRKSYLENFAENEDLATHRGMFSVVNKAKRELEGLKEDSIRYNDFINRYLSTNKEADIRILGCFVEEE